MKEQAGLTFAEFRLDPDRGELLRGTAPVALTPKAFALLEYLAARAGRPTQTRETAHPSSCCTG